MTTKSIYTCPQGFCVLVDDHPANTTCPVTGVESVAVHYVKKNADGVWYAWNAGALARSALGDTSDTMEA